MTDNKQDSEMLLHAADLARQSGKLRTAEWLTVCSTLPLGEWPPAPAYKGPVIPASEHDKVKLELIYAVEDGKRWCRQCST